MKKLAFSQDTPLLSCVINMGTETLILEGLLVREQSCLYSLSWPKVFIPNVSLLCKHRFPVQALSLA